MLVLIHHHNLGVAHTDTHPQIYVSEMCNLVAFRSDHTSWLGNGTLVCLAAYHFLNVLCSTIENPSLPLCGIFLISLERLLSLCVLVTPSESPPYPCFSRSFLVILQVQVKGYHSLMLSWFLNTVTLFKSWLLNLSIIILIFSSNDSFTMKIPTVLSRQALLPANYFPSKVACTYVVCNAVCAQSLSSYND